MYVYMYYYYYLLLGVSDTRSTSTFIVQPAAVHLPEPDEDCVDEEEEPNDRTFVIHTSSLHQVQYILIIIHCCYSYNHMYMYMYI